MRQQQLSFNRKIFCIGFTAANAISRSAEVRRSRKGLGYRFLSARARDHAHDTNRRSIKVKSPLHESEQRTSTFAHFHNLGGRIGGPARHRHCNTEPLIRCHRSGRSDVQSDGRMMGIRVVKQGQ